MREQFIEDSRYRRTRNLLEEVWALSRSSPKVIIIVAPPGCGKTTLLRHLCVELGWVWFSLREYMSPTWLFGALADEVAGWHERNLRENHRLVIDALRETPRGIICDEAHRLAHYLKRYEGLRDVTDDAGVPLVLVGTEDLVRAVRALPPLESRVAGWITIAPCDFADAALYAEQLCEDAIADDLIKVVHEVTAGSARGIVIALSRLEALALRRGKKRLSLADVPERFSFTYATRNRRHALATNTAIVETAKPALKAVS